MEKIHKAQTYEETKKMTNWWNYVIKFAKPQKITAEFKNEKRNIRTEWRLTKNNWELTKYTENGIIKDYHRQLTEKEFDESTKNSIKLAETGNTITITIID